MPYTTISNVYAAWTIATSAGVTVASGDFTVGAGGTTTLGGALNIRDSGRTTHLSGFATTIITITAQPDTDYWPVAAPFNFNPLTYGGFWVASKSATAFAIQTGSASNNVSSLSFTWIITR